MHINPLVSELSGRCSVQKTRDLNGHPLFYVFLANDFRWHLLISTSQCAL